MEFATELVAAVGCPEVDNYIGSVCGEVVDGLLFSRALELFTFNTLGFGREDGGHGGGGGMGERWLLVDTFGDLKFGGAEV